MTWYSLALLLRFLLLWTATTGGQATEGQSATTKSILPHWTEGASTSTIPACAAGQSATTNSILPHWTEGASTSTIPACAAGPAEDDAFHVTEELRIIVVGKTGVGKSAVGNTILGRKAFKSEAKATSVTAECMRQMDYYSDGRLVSVIDTPGLYDTSFSNEHILQTISKCVVLAAPGPHAILLVLQIGRFTPEEKEAVTQIRFLFGEEAAQYIIIVFTRKEDLEGKSIQDYIDEADENLKSVVKSCNNRSLAFNNKAQGAKREKQVRELFTMVKEMVKDNGGSWYTTEMFEHAQEAVRRREREIRDKLEREGRMKSKRAIREEAEHDVITNIIDACKRAGAYAMQTLRDVGAKLKQIFL